MEARCDGQSECYATCGGSFSCSEERHQTSMAKFIGNWGLHCKGSFSCEGLQVDRIRGDLVCRNSFSCERLNIVQGITGDINCKGSFACEKMTAKNIDGDLICDGSSSCESMSVNCKAGAKCTAKCSGSSACTKDRRSNPTLFTGHWNLECTSSFSCRDIEARCPTGKSCMATCTGWGSCEGANFVGNWMRIGPNGGD